MLSFHALLGHFAQGREQVPGGKALPKVTQLVISNAGLGPRLVLSFFLLLLLPLCSPVSCNTIQDATVGSLR